MNGPAMIEKKRFHCQETMCVLPGMNLVCLYIRVYSRFEFQVRHSSLKCYIDLNQGTGPPRYFWQTRPPHWQPLYQHTAAAAALFYFVKSRQDPGLGGLASRGNREGDMKRLLNCSSHVLMNPASMNPDFFQKKNFGFLEGCNFIE